MIINNIILNNITLFIKDFFGLKNIARPKNVSKWVPKKMIIERVIVKKSKKIDISAGFHFTSATHFPRWAPHFHSSAFSNNFFKRMRQLHNAYKWHTIHHYSHTDHFMRPSQVSQLLGL